MEVSHVVFKYIALIVMAICHSVSATCSSPAKVVDGKAQYADIKEKPVKTNISLTYDAKGLQPVFDIATSFMNTVQPKGFMETFQAEKDLEKLITDDWEKLIKDYELPIVITLGVGLLFVLLMPIVGCCFCMCRCCDRCGGDMKQSEKKAKKHCRVAFMVFLLFAFTVLMLCGVLFMFVTNDRMHEAIGDTEKKLDEVLAETDNLVKVVTDDIDILANDQVQCVTGMVRRGIGKEGLRTMVGIPLQKEVSANVTGYLNQSEALVADVDTIETTLKSANDTQTSFNTNANRLNKEIKDGKDKKTDIHNRRCGGATGVKKTVCDDLNAINLNVDLDTPGMPDIKTYLSKVNDIQGQKLGQSIAQGKQMVNDIPELVFNNTRGPLKSVYDLLNSTEIKISDVAGNVSSSIQKGYNKITKGKTIDNIRDILNNDDFKKFEAIRWKVYVALSAVMALIVFLLFCGLACGSCGYNKDYMPTERSATANCGGNFLMAAVGIMFIFSFIFMIFCVVWFGVGMHLHIVCRGLKDGQIIDDVFNRFNSSIDIPDDFKNLSVVDALKNCRKNMPIYQAVSLIEEKYSIDSLFNIKVFDEVEADIENKTDFDLDTVLTPEAKRAMEDVLNYTIDYASIERILNTSIMEANITEIVVDLGKLANDIRAGDADFAREIDELKTDLNNTQTTTIKFLEGNIEAFKSNVETLKSQVEPLKTKTSDLLDGLEQSPIFVKMMIKELILPYTKELLGYVTDGVEHVTNQVKTNVLHCKPVANIYDGTVNTYMCDNLVQNSNGFWLALGWCLLFFIPAIIVAVKLAKYFRKMDYSTGMDIQVDHPPYNDKLPHHTPPYTTGYSSHGGHDLRAPPPYTSTQHNNPGYQHA